MYSATLLYLLVTTVMAERQNIATGKAAHQTSTLYFNGYNWNASLALDGVKHFTNDSCRCCSATYYDYNVWWEVDLGKVYNIGRIDVYGRYDDSGVNQLPGFKLYASEASQSFSSSVPVYTNNMDLNEFQNVKGYIRVIFGSHTARYVALTKGSWSSKILMTICEIEVFEACPPRTFEPNCTTCHCLDHEPCNKMTGECARGCDVGWTGASCSTSCSPDTFGRNCSLSCHCAGEVACDRYTGVCPGGGCQLGWTGISCNISTNIALNKTVRLVSQYSYYGPDKAVDGNLLTDHGTCHCCAATIYQHSPYLELDLGKIYHVQSVVIYGRTDRTEQSWQDFNGLRIYLEKVRYELTSPSFTVGNDPAEKRFYNLTLTPAVDLQYVRLVLYGYSKRLVVCEIQVFPKECDDGTFGASCEHFCYCEGPPCNKTSGFCPSGKCQAGYHGNKCDTECRNGTYGSECSRRCGNCANDRPCHHVNGHCDMCDPGYTGDLCTQTCQNHTYGINCTGTCGHCLQNGSCDAVTGKCDNGCSSGYMGSFCKDVCPAGLFGVNCQMGCGHCRPNTTCHRVDGVCGEGCDVNYVGDLCVQESERLSGDDSGTNSAVVGGVAGALVCVLIILVVGLVFFIRHRRSRAPSDKEETASYAIKFKRSLNRQKDVTKDVDTEYSEVDIVTNPENVEETATEDEDNSPGEYYAFLPREEDVKIHQLWDFIYKRKADQSKFFVEEFKVLRKGLLHKHSTATTPENRPKNKYKGLYAYDHTRVKLQTDKHGDSDYINACFINGYDKMAKFIAAQGPIQTSIDDFWRMIWQQNCSIIIMLTNVVELGHVKCDLYWPEEETDEELYGDIVVKFAKTDTSLDYNIRHFEIRMGDSPTRHVRQYHFKSWPDKTVPDNTWALVNFRRLVNSDDTIHDLSPVVVHCSAGVGRTGTFIALDNLYQQGVKEGCVRPLQVVQALREQRVNMVQTAEQYEYLHEAVADAFLIGTHYFFPSQLEAICQYMSQKGEDSKTGYETQFKLIDKSVDDQMSGTGEEYLNLPKGGQHNARGTLDRVIYAQNYSDETTFVIANCPDISKHEELWSLIEENNIRTIVVLGTEVVDEYEVLLLNENDLVGNVRSISINVADQSSQDHVIEYTVTVANSKKNKEPRSVKCFVYTDWKRGVSVPNGTKSLLGLVSAVQRWQPRNSKKEPILLLSRNDVSMCGMVGIILNELDRMQYNDGKLNIVHSVKQFKRSHSLLLSHPKQLQLCYETLLAYTGQSDIYQNM